MARELDIQAFGTLKQEFNNNTLFVSVTQVLQDGQIKAVVYRCHLNKDWDGAPDAYGENRAGSKYQHGLKPRDGLANATSPHTEYSAGGNNFEWVGVISMTIAEAAKWGVEIDTDAREAFIRTIAVTDKNGHDTYVKTTFPKGKGYYPVINTRKGKYQGYYVSSSGARTDRGSAKKLREWDPDAYLDAASIPYAVLPNVFQRARLRLGDIGLAIRNSNGTKAGFFFGDTGSEDKVGESSGYLFEALQGLNSNYNEDYSTFLAFPGSGSGATDEGVAKQTPGIVGARLREISVAPNSDDFLLLLALQCDLTAWNRIKANEDAKAKVRDTADYRTFASSLIDAGFIPYIVQEAVGAVAGFVSSLRPF